MAQWVSFSSWRMCAFLSGLLLLLAASPVTAADSASGPPPEEKRSLKELLVEKGIITEEEEQTLKEPLVLLRYGKKGFELTTADHRFRLAIGSQLQFLYTASAFNNSSGMTDVSSFRIRRAKIYFNGHAWLPELMYKIQFNLASGAAKLEDLYIDWQRFPWAQIKIGQYKVPFSRQRMSTTRKLHLVDRAVTDKVFSLGRDIGITLHSPIAKRWIEYSVGVYNGEGVNKTNSTTGHLFVGRVVLYPLGPFAYYAEPDVEMTPRPKIGIGFAYALASRGLAVLDADTMVDDRVDTKMGALDLMFKYRGVSLIVELLQRITNPRDTDTPGTNVVSKAQGVNLQVGVFLIPKRLEVAGRYGRVDSDDQLSQNTQREVGGSVNIYFFGHQLKLQTDYLRIRTEMGPGTPTEINNQVQSQLQMIF